MKPKKTWTEKLNDSKDLPKIIELDNDAALRWGGKTMIIPAPIEVDELMRKVPKGRITTINQIRQALAKKYKAEIGCPITTGIFAWIAANAADESESKGDKKVMPYWRTLKSDGSLNPKYPGGVDNQASRLKAEGFEVDESKKSPKVKDFEKSLYDF